MQVLFEFVRLSGNIEIAVETIGRFPTKPAPEIGVRNFEITRIPVVISRTDNLK